MYKGILFLLLIIFVLIGCGKPRLNENDAQKFLNYFYNDKVPEEITDRYLLTAGRGIVPYLIDEVQKRDMLKRGYAIGALGKLGDRRALPVLIKILGDNSEVHYFREDALVSICYLDKSLGEEMIEKYAGQSESFDRQIGLLKKGMYDNDYNITWWDRLKDKIIFLLDKHNILHV